MSVVKEIVEATGTAAPNFLRFDRVPKENKKLSEEQGRYVAVDVDMVTIIPPNAGGKQEFVQQWSKYVIQMQQEVDAGRLPKAWRDRYLAEYEAWKSGQELPLQGTPIKGWGMISPAQQETLIRNKIRTVEDLAQVNQEGMRHLGMGSLEMRNKAVSWLSQMTDKGPLTMQMSAMQQENTILKGSLETLQRQVDALRIAIPAVAATEYKPAPTESITASDIIEDEPPKPKRR